MEPKTKSGKKERQTDILKNLNIDDKHSRKQNLFSNGLMVVVDCTENA